MTDETLPTGPGPDAIARLIQERHPDAVVAQALNAWFFSLDESHWPNFATIVTTDEHDLGEPSRLSRPGVFRLNLGVGKATKIDSVEIKWPSGRVDKLTKPPLNKYIKVVEGSSS